MAHEFRFKVSDTTYNFLEKLAKHDNISVHEEAENLFWMQIYNEREAKKEFWPEGWKTDVNGCTENGFC